MPYTYDDYAAKKSDASYGAMVRNKKPGVRRRRIETEMNVRIAYRMRDTWV